MNKYEQEKSTLLELPILKHFDESKGEIALKANSLKKGEKGLFWVIALGLLVLFIFIGKVRDTAHVLELSDVFLLPSETESFGLAALEAMVCGVPVISSNSGGLPEVNKDGFSGYLSNVGDVAKMSQDAISLLKDAEKLKQFKINAFETAKLFDIQQIMPLYEQVYYQAIHSKND